MNNKLNKSGFTLIEILSVIVILGILLVVGITAVQKVMENTKKSAFISDALMYIKTAKYKKSIQDGDISVYTIGIDDSISEMKLDSSVEDDGISPYGTEYEGYVIAKNINGKMQYSIFLKDGKESDSNSICNSIGFVSSNVRNYYSEETIDESILVSTKCHELTTTNDDGYNEFVTGTTSSITANILTSSGNESETVGINNNGSGNLTVTNLLERGSKVFLKVCDDVEFDVTDYDSCLIAFSVLINNSNELYLYERPIRDSKRNMSFISINTSGSEKLETIPYMTTKYKEILGDSTTVRLLSLKDIYNVLNNDYLASKNLLQFAQIVVPFSWSWINSHSYNGFAVCPDGREELNGKCVFNPNAYVEKTESALRTYFSTIYWISGANSDLSGDISATTSFNCSSYAKFYTSKCPYLSLNEKQVLNLADSIKKVDNKDVVGYDNIPAEENQKRSYYAYYVVKADNEAFKDKLYCMNDDYNDFELCNEFNQHN